MKQASIGLYEIEFFSATTKPKENQTWSPNRAQQPQTGGVTPQTGRYGPAISAEFYTFTSKLVWGATPAPLIIDQFWIIQMVACAVDSTHVLTLLVNWVFWWTHSFAGTTGVFILHP